MFSDPSFPILTPRGLNGHGLLMQQVPGGHLVPLFLEGFSPAPFLRSSGLEASSPMIAFDTMEQFREFLRQAVANPEAFQVVGFVFNPTVADLRQYKPAPPLEILARLDARVG